MKRVLHCVIDEKFIDPLIGFLSHFICSVDHVFVIVSNTVEVDFKYIQKRDVVKRVIESDFSIYINNNTFDAIIVHGLRALPPSLIVKIPQSVRVIWLAWGYDIYQPIYGHKPLIQIRHLLHNETLKYMNQRPKNYLKVFFYNAKVVFRKKRIERAINRFDFFSGIIPEEYDMIKQEVTNVFFRAIKADFSYGNLESSRKESNLNQPFSDGNSILVGNSADETNNHMDVINALSRINLNGKSVICPLSYAGKPDYVKTVVSYGDHLLGDSFKPILDFMSYDKYQELLHTVQYSIFLLERQQAMGNIVQSLWNGNMVFLSETSPMYTFFKNRGYAIFSIQKDLWRIDKGEVLPLEVKKRNREQVLSYFSLDAIKKRDVDFFERVLA